MEEQRILEFVRTAVGSVWALELLILLRRERRGRSLNDLVRELRSSDAALIGALKSMQRAGLVAEIGQGIYKYEPASAALDKLAARTQEIYAVMPSTLIAAMFAGSNEKLRTFADAFRLKR